ncbi:TPA: hypothetical protein ACS7XC_001310 [Providencia alcalifaciens]
MFSSLNFNYKFNQYKIIDHYKDVTKNEFSKNFIGAHNMKSLEAGICYGLTHLFLRYAHINKEKKYVTNFYHDIKAAKKLSTNKDILINHHFYTASKIQMLTTKAVNINNSIANFHYTDQLNNEKSKDYINRLFELNRVIFLEHNLNEKDIKEFKLNLNELYDYSYPVKSKEESLKKNIPTENFLLAKYAREVKKYCSKYSGNDLSANYIGNFFALMKKYHIELIKNPIIEDNNKHGIRYDSYTTIDGITKENHCNVITLAQFKQRITNRLFKKQDTICDFLTRYHAMGISIKHAENKVVFEFFEPNKGLFITTNEKKFFKFIDKIVSQQECLMNEKNEPIIEVNTSYADKLHQYPLSDKIKEPQFYKS